MKKLTENLYVMPQLSNNDFAEIAESGVKTIINNRPDDEETGQLNHLDAKSLAESHGMSYHYLPMENGKPLPDNLVADFKSLLATSEQPVLAHCRSGMRSTILWALGKIGDKDISVEQAISMANDAGIPLEKVRTLLESAV